MMKEVDYRCTTPSCGNAQTIRLFPNEPVPQVLACVRCRAGFGKELTELLIEQSGMLPTCKPRHVHDDEGRMLGLDSVGLDRTPVPRRKAARA